jgi:hypothetical protein
MDEYQDLDKLMLEYLDDFKKRKPRFVSIPPKNYPFFWLEYFEEQIKQNKSKNEEN